MMDTKRISVVLALALLTSLAACSTTSTSIGQEVDAGPDPPAIQIPLLAAPGLDFGIGRSLIATIQVTEDLGYEEFADEAARGLRITVLEAHWVGQPLNSLVQTPPVVAGQQLDVLRLPGLDYRVGETYIASLNFFGSYSPTYEWWLSTGLAQSGTVVTNHVDPSRVQATFDLAAVSAETAGPADLFTRFAIEWAAMLDSRDRGVPWDNRPLGPMLRAIFIALGNLPATDAPTPLERFLSLDPVHRDFPMNIEELDFIHEAGISLGIEWVELQGVILHSGELTDVESVALWFPGIGRSHQMHLDHEVGVTYLRTVIPADILFEIVGYTGTSPSTDNTGRPVWDTTLMTVGNVPRPSTDGSGLRVLLDYSNRRTSWLTAEQFFDRIMALEPVLSPGGQRSD